MELQEKDKKTDVINSLKKELMEGSFDDASILQRDSKLKMNEILSIVNTVFSELCSQKKFERAIEIANRYNLSPDKIKDAVLKSFIFHIGKGEYEKAVTWGLDHKLPSSEIQKATVKIFESLITKKDIKGALGSIEKYNIPHDLVMNTAVNAFNDAIQREDYLSAAILGKEFNMPKKRVLFAAVSSFIKEIEKGNWESLIKIENEFDIISDSTYDELMERDRDLALDSFFKKVIQENLKKGKVKLVVQILEATRLLNRKYSNDPLKELTNKILLEIARLHNILLTRGEENEAIGIKDQFELLGSDSPLEVKSSVLGTAESYHNMLLKKYQLYEAKTIKEKYNLFGKNMPSENFSTGLSPILEFLETSLLKGDFEKSHEVVKEYLIQKDKLKEVAKKVIVEKLSKMEIENALTIINKFEIDTSDETLKAEAQNKFDDIVDSGRFDIAAELGKIFKLDGGKTKEAAFKSWEKHIRNGRYGKATNIKREYKIPIAWTKPIAKEIYEYNLQISKPDIAQKIRSEYGIELGVIDLIKEFFAKLFH